MIRLFIAVLLVGLALSGGAAMAQDVPEITLDGTGPQATKLIILLALFVFALIAMRQVRLPQVLRAAAIWIGIFVVLLAFYAYRVPLENAGREMASVLMPGMAISQGEQVVVRRSFGGQFVVRGSVDDEPVEFIFDTGASLVVLSAADAERAGFASEQLDYRVPVMTAAGMTTVAPVRLDTLRIGSIDARDVRAAIAQPGDLEHSLLGMTFLNRLTSYEVRRDRLVLNP